MHPPEIWIDEHLDEWDAAEAADARRIDVGAGFKSYAMDNTQPDNGDAGISDGGVGDYSELGRVRSIDLWHGNSHCAVRVRRGVCMREYRPTNASVARIRALASAAISGDYRPNGADVGAEFWHGRHGTNNVAVRVHAGAIS